ncbi:hypothetical protein BaRGS_00022716 [Batillaria attramentaria]|uniref:Uncharacterized protein n=1 Tax=Batillaria attramentaria TaxID=370345 RepID=A0ABD0KGC6_9CAEN
MDRSRQFHIKKSTKHCRSVFDLQSTALVSEQSPEATTSCTYFKTSRENRCTLTYPWDYPSKAEAKRNADPLEDSDSDDGSNVGRCL